MAQRPEDRFQSASEMLTQLRAASIKVPPTLDTLPVTKKSNRSLFLGLGVGVVAVLALLWSLQGPKPKIVAAPAQPVKVISEPAALTQPAKTLEAKTLEAPAQEVLTLEMEVIQIENTNGKIIKDRFLTSGDSVTNGDFFELTLTVNQDAYVYVVNLSSEGDVAMILPQEGDLLVKKDTPKRLPEGTEDGFSITGAAGYENLYAIVSSEPISKADSEVALLIADIRSGKLPAVKPEKLRVDTSAPAGLPGLERRAIGVAKVVPKVSRGATAKVTLATVDKQGLALVHLWLKHLK